jgi:hypothetical protein
MEQTKKETIHSILYHVMVHPNDITKITDYVKNGNDINLLNESGITALYLSLSKNFYSSARDDQIKVIECLLNNGANPHIKNSNNPDKSFLMEVFKYASKEKSFFIERTNNFINNLLIDERIKKELILNNNCSLDDYRSSLNYITSISIISAKKCETTESQNVLKTTLDNFYFIDEDHKEIVKSIRNENHNLTKILVNYQCDIKSLSMKIVENNLSSKFYACCNVENKNEKLDILRVLVQNIDPNAYYVPKTLTYRKENCVERK